MTWPTGAMGIQLQFTADPMFTIRVSKWIRHNILRFRQILVPFHIPSSNVREKPHQSLKDFLHINNVSSGWPSILMHLFRVAVRSTKISSQILVF